MRDHVPTERVRIDGGTQPRTAISDALVSEYADAMHGGAELPPVDLFFDGVDYWLADGFHRYHAAMRLGLDRLTCELHTGTRRDAVLFSCGANAGHGLRRTNEDKRKSVKTLLEDAEWCEWSNREIARRCGVHHEFVSDVRMSLSDQPIVTHRSYITKQGTEATMNTGRIGRKVAPAENEEPKFRSREAVKQRREQMRDMAGKGHSSRQIASALGITHEGCRIILRTEGIDVPADRAVGKSQRHDATRIIKHMVMDAENLTADVNLINLDDVDPARLPEWLGSLKSSQDKLGDFIRTLMKEIQKHEAA